MLTRLETAKIHVQGIEILQAARHITPIAGRNVNQAGTLRKARDDAIHASGLTAIILYAVAVEQVVKYLYEGEQRGRKAHASHNTRKLFPQLSESTQSEIKRIYTQCMKAYDEVAQAALHQTGAVIKTAPLTKALAWNDETMKDFKYTLTPHGQKTVPCGIAWNKETLWVLPPEAPNFAVALTEWAGREELF